MLSLDSSDHHVFKLVIIGESGVGKSSLLLRFANNLFPEMHSATVGIDSIIRTITVDGERVKLQIWDTAGQERFRLITSSYYRDVDGVIVVYDVTDMNSFISAKYWLQEVQENCREATRLLVGNKNENPALKIVPTRKAKSFAELYEMEFIEASAMESNNVEKLFAKIALSMLRKKSLEQSREVTYGRDDTIILNDARMDDIRERKRCC